MNLQCYQAHLLLGLVALFLVKLRAILPVDIEPFIQPTTPCNRLPSLHGIVVPAILRASSGIDRCMWAYVSATACSDQLY